LKDPEAFDLAVDMIEPWSKDQRREGAKVCLQALADKRIGGRDQATGWIWRLADYTRELHEQYAVQRWPETKRLLGLLVNSSGAAHARNARKLVQAIREQDRRLQVAILASAVAHTPEAEEVLRGARTRLARKPGSCSRELLRNFPQGKGRRKRSRRRRSGGANAAGGNRQGAGRNGDGQAKEPKQEENAVTEEGGAVVADESGSSEDQAAA
jgi:ribonuclease E